VLHELLTGQKPADDPRLTSVISGCDIRFDAIVRTATNPMPEMRYANASVMARELHQLEDSLGRATKAVDLRAPTSLHRMPGPSSRAPGPVRRAPTAVARASYAGGNSGSKGLFTTILLLGAVVAIAWLILKTGIKVQPQAPAEPPASSEVDSNSGSSDPNSPSFGKQAAQKLEEQKRKQEQQGNQSAFGSTTPPKQDEKNGGQ